MKRLLIATLAVAMVATLALALTKSDARIEDQALKKAETTQIAKIVDTIRADTAITVTGQEDAEAVLTARNTDVKGDSTRPAKDQGILASKTGFITQHRRNALLTDARYTKNDDALHKKVDATGSTGHQTMAIRKQVTIDIGDITAGATVLL